MQFDGALVREQGVTFAVVSVKNHVIQNASEAQSVIREFAPAFPGVPIVLMGQGNSGRATFFGRKDIAQFLSRISPSRLPWRHYTI
jgi:hypothetical protein